MKVFLLVVTILFCAGAYWYFNADPNGGNGKQLATANRFKNKAGKVEVINAPSKTEAYQNEVIQDVEENKNITNVLEQQDPQHLTSSIQKAMRSPYDKKLDELKSEKVTLKYNSQSFSKENNTTQATNTNERPLKVMAARVPKKSAGEIKTQSVKSPDSVTRKSGFNTKYASSNFNNEVKDTDTQSNTANFKAVVYGDHNIKSGGLVRFRTTEEMTINGVTFKRNTVFNGQASFGQERINITINRIPLKSGGYLTTNLILYDQDMNEGIYAPISPGKEAATSEALGNVESLIGSTGTVAGAVGSGLTRVFRSAANGAQKISIDDAYPVVFIVKEK